jgi:L-2-hydroxyglutarate oxidase LhgO
MLFPDVGIGGRIFPPDLTHFLNAYYRKKGVEVLSGERVTNLEQRGEQFVLKTRQGQEIVVDSVVVGLGIEPNTKLAQQAGLKAELKEKKENIGFLKKKSDSGILTLIFSARDTEHNNAVALKKYLESI